MGYRNRQKAERVKQRNLPLATQQIVRMWLLIYY